MNQALFDAGMAVKTGPITQPNLTQDKVLSERLKVVIVGGGFGGLSAAKALAKAPVDVILIDRHNYHLFQPLLYQVATAALTSAEIASPIRGILRKQKNTTVYLDTVVGIDKERRLVHTESGRSFPYDYLILATGAQHSYFGNDQWAEFAPGLKTIDDATELRRRILIAFERAEMETDDQESHDAFLAFVIVGGGPTGVEMAGAIAELAHSIAYDFRHISTRCAKILLVEAGDRILPQFDPMLSKRAKRDLESLGVKVLVNTRVEEVGQGYAVLNGATIRAETVIWAAGVKSSPAGEWLGVKTDRSGRVIVEHDLSVPSHEEIFVIGDAAALVPSSSDRPLPGLAPVAKQQGYYVGNLINAWIAKRKILL
jgi:NADH:ubiquinone reductase (H+-translocating)